MFALCVFAAVFWPTRPERIIAMIALQERRGEEGEANGRKMRDKLIACGPSAINPTIDAIRGHTAWTRGYAYLPQVLQGLGEPAHRALLAAIDAERDASVRGYLISALQRAFTDYSRLDIWLADAANGTVSSYQITHFARDLRHTFPDAPELRADGRVSKDFLEWWQRHQQTNR
ncbi:MAG TPA: hypothetical protein VK615_09235 [Candidatus Binatia bacterium]|nr:hypothetical protein [Candidatus Binatia bacterium]